MGSEMCIRDSPCSNPPPVHLPSAHAIIRKSQTKTELAQYLHACAGHPPVSTFTKAILNGNYLSWPGIADLSFRKHFPSSLPSAKGHLDQERKKLQSTQANTVPTPSLSENEDFFPPKTQKTFDRCAYLYTFQPTHTAYGDLTGRFPHKSSRGNQYLLVIYDYDSNAILVEALQSKQATEIK